MLWTCLEILNFSLLLVRWREKLTISPTVKSLMRWLLVWDQRCNIDEKELVATLLDGRLGGAGLDVFGEWAGCTWRNCSSFKMWLFCRMWVVTRLRPASARQWRILCLLTWWLTFPTNLFLLRFCDWFLSDYIHFKQLFIYFYRGSNYRKPLICSVDMGSLFFPILQFSLKFGYCWSQYSMSFAHKMS